MNKETIYKYYIYGILLALVVTAGIIGMRAYQKGENKGAVKAKVISVYFDNTEDGANLEDANSYRYQEVELKITEGSHKNETYWMRNTIETADIYQIHLKQGDRVLISLTEDETGTITNLHLFDRDRAGYLYFLMALFFLMIIGIGKIQGAKAMITLIFTGVMVVEVLLPGILRGINPILMSVLVCGIIVAVTLTVISGFSRKTLTAIAGTISGVLIAGLIALLTGSLCEITGLANEHAQNLVYLLKYPNLDFTGILFAGIIVGAMGAVMDVSMSISSAMYEIMSVKPKISSKELARSGMNIGKDIMGSMSNTLILAYTGGSLELMLLFMSAGTSWREIINLDMVASEVIRAVAGSIGLASTIPLTVAICILLRKGKAQLTKKKK